MRSIRTYGRALFLAAMMAGAAATSAQAQFGALRRAAAGVVTRGAENTVAPAGPASGSTARPPQFDHEVLEITPAILTRFTAAMNAERAERAEIAAQRATMGDLQAQVERYERCQRREDDRREAEDNSVDQAAQAQVAARMTQAMMRGDTGTYRRMIDSLTNAQAARAGRSAQACGGRPNQAYATLASLNNPEQRLLDAGAEAGGFTVRQLAVLKERIAPYVLSNGNLGGASAAYTAAELEALRGAAPGLWGFATELRT